MTTITTRAGKGTPLTNNELDANFVNLNAEVTPSRPTIRPSLLLDFSNSKAVDPRITFTRSTKASYYDANGVLQYANANAPRIDHDPATGECKGLLVEEQRTNSIYYSDQLRIGTSPYNTRVYDKAAVAPDGTMSAIRFTDDGSLNEHCLNNTYFSSIVQGTTYTISAYMKADGSGAKGVLRYYGNEWVHAVYNLSTGTVDVNASQTGAFSSGMTPVGNGWYRCWFTHTATGNYGTVVTQACVANSSNSFYFSGTGALGVYIWGYQFEVASFPTSYIPSTTTFTSRASGATYIDSTGTLRYAGVNQPRYSYGYDSASGTWKSQGLVLEAAATNMWRNSQFSVGLTNWYFNSWDLANNPYSVATTTLPDGTSGTALYKTGTGTGAADFGDYGLSYAANTTSVFSFWAKGSGTITANAGGVIGSVISGGSWTLTSNWTKYTMVFTTNSSPSGYWWMNCTYATSMYMTWVQLETGYAPTSYIPTYGSSATRSADVSSSAQTTRVADKAVMTGAAFASVFNQTEGSIFWQRSRANSAALPELTMYADTGGGADFYYKSLAWLNTSGSVASLNNSATQFSQSTSIAADTNLVSTAFGYKENSMAASTNGSSPTTDTVATVQQGVNTLGIAVPNATNLNQHIRRVALYPKRLSNSELQALTK